LSPTDQSGSQVSEAKIALFGFLKADQEFAEAIEPGVAAFDDPAPRPVALDFGPSLFLALFDVGFVSLGQNSLPGWFSLVSGICAKMLNSPSGGRPGDDDLLQGGG